MKIGEELQTLNTRSLAEKVLLLYLAKAGIAIASPAPHPPFRQLCNVFIKSGEPSTPLGLINELKAINKNF
jgi:hypothetical protein